MKLFKKLFKRCNHKYVILKKIKIMSSAEVSVDIDDGYLIKCSKCGKTKEVYTVHLINCSRCGNENVHGDEYCRECEDDLRIYEQHT